ncbi:MAG: hypothetical protein KC457_00445 [Myxococcales bacterium]|nr:hypothetical protein [Myxococcales bacterium]
MSTRVYFIVGAATFSVLGASCIIPDTDIVVKIADPCGEQWTVQTVGAYGYTAVGQVRDIKNDKEDWLSKTYCFNAADSKLLEDPTSDLADSLLADIVMDCEARAYELGILDTDQTCITTANLAWVGPCESPMGGCMDAPEDSGNDEAEGGTDSTGTDTSAPDFTALDLTTLVHVENGETVVSQTLIDTGLADLVGVGLDGTLATLVKDEQGVVRGFELSGIGDDNLGAVLGWENGDVIVKVAGVEVGSFDDLLLVAALLLEANEATVVLERRGAVMELVYRRGD